MSLTSKIFRGPTAAASSTEDNGAPALDFKPVKKTELDIFARAPQVKKPTRKEKQLIIQEMHAKKGALSVEKVASHLTAKEDTGIIETVLEMGEVEREVAAQERRNQKKGKKHVLRHALHKNEEEDARTVFVGNLPNTVERREVERIFRDCGGIECVRVRCQVLEETTEKGMNAGRAIRVLRGEIKKDDQFSATAYVLFKSDSSVAAAVQKNGIMFKNRHLIVTTMDVEGRTYSPATSIFIGNIAYDTTEEALWNFFAEHGIGDVKRVRLVRDRDTGACKGFGYVEFLHRGSVKTAIDTRGSKLNGREIRITHVNASKETKASSVSRREKRKEIAAMPARARKQSRPDREEDRSRDSAKRPRREEDTPSWMGVTTNPRRKIPKDLRPLTEGKRDRPSLPRAPVKRKMRNPEKL